MSDYGIQRLSALIARLTLLTEQGKISWRTGAAADSFQFTSAKASVAILSRDGDGRSPYRLEVYSDEGAVVDALETEFWWHPESDESIPQDWNEPLARLYEIARRSALNIDAVIDSLFSELPDPNP